MNNNIGQKVLLTAKAYLMTNERYKNDQGDLCLIFNSSDLVISDTPKFSYRRWNQTIHTGRLDVPISLFESVNNLENSIKEIINKVYPENDDHYLDSITISPKLIENDEEYEEFMAGYLSSIPSYSDAKFQKIEDEIIQAIRNARYSIWVVSPWLSNKKLLNELARKKRQGVSIRVILSNESSNQKFIPRLRQLFDTRVIEKWGDNEQNRLHEKFCIIDLKIVGHGSYNWSENANYNQENWVTSYGGGLVLEFADQFQKLYLQGH